MSLGDQYEKIASISPSTAGFGRDGGRAVLPVFISRSGLYQGITDILGTVKRGKDGRLIRGEPSSHPQYRWMLANKITSIQGYGKPTMATAAFAGNNSNTHDRYALYDWYLATIEFVHQPFVSKNDSQIQVVATKWDDDDGVERNTKYAEEWLRFTSYDIKPGVEVVTANYGFQKFRTIFGQPNGFTFPGAPRVVVGKSQLLVTWHFVPLSILNDDTGPIVKYLGRINQKEWKTPWKTYSPGSLLYVGVDAKRYLPYIPAGKIDVLGTLILDAEYVADITFAFDYTKRSVAYAPTPDNGNWIAAGWNTKPWIQDRKFYYVTSTDGTPTDSDSSKWVPTYLSFDVRSLFTDPAVL